MKLKIIFFTVATLFICSLVSAAENLLLDAESQRKYERKVQLQLIDMGIKSRHATFPVFFCPKSKSKSVEKELATAILSSLTSAAPIAGGCIPVGAWDFKISQALEQQAAELLMQRLSGKRYDVLRIKQGKLSLKTLTETLETDSAIPAFTFATGNFSQFNQSVGDYLNKNLAPLMGNILRKAKDARYQEMKDKERETFLATIAKDQSVPAKFIEKLMNSAFVFAAYTDKPTGSVSIHEKNKNRRLWFATTVTVDLNARLAVYRFNADTGRFDFYKQISGRSGTVSASEHLYSFRPTNPISIIASFNDSYVVAAKAAGINLNINLKEDDLFAIYSTIDEIDAPQFYSSIGDIEDVRIDSPYIIYQYIDGQKVRMGWGKARKVASEKVFRKNNAEYKTQFDLVRGDMEMKDQLREHPWSGVLGFIDVGTMTLNVDSMDGENTTGGGSFSGVHLGTKMDLGYMFNSPGMSEVWLELALGYGVGGEDIVLNNATKWDNLTVTTLGFDLAFRHHLSSSGLYLAYKFGLGGAEINGSTPGALIATEDVKIRSNFAFNWGAQAGYLLTPNSEFFVNAQGMLPLVAEYESNNETLEAELSGGVDVNIGYAMHFKSIGGLARGMK